MHRVLRLTVGGLLVAALGCTTLPLPEQPSETQPYAVLAFPGAIRVLAIDAQELDTRARLDTIRVTPGRHTLRLAYVGPSVPHAGQQIDPVMYELHEGRRYQFEAKT